MKLKADKTQNLLNQKSLENEELQNAIDRNKQAYLADLQEKDDEIERLKKQLEEQKDMC